MDARLEYVKSRWDKGQRMLQAIKSAPLHDIRRMFVEDGWQADTFCDYEVALTHAAVNFNRLDVLRWLINEEGANPALPDGNQDYFPVHYAGAGDLECLAFLVTKTGVNATSPKSRRTPLHCACFCGSIEAVRYLMRSGADVAVTDRHGETPLHIACHRRHSPVIHALVTEYHVSVDALDQQGRTPLVTYLMNYGSDAVLSDLVLLASEQSVLTDEMLTELKVVGALAIFPEAARQSAREMVHHLIKLR